MSEKLPIGAISNTRKNIDKLIESGVKTFYWVWPKNYFDHGITVIYITPQTNWKSDYLRGINWRNLGEGGPFCEHMSNDGGCEMKNGILFLNYWLAYGYMMRIKNDR